MPINDDEALQAFSALCKAEGIIPALESSHALAQAMKELPSMSRDEILYRESNRKGRQGHAHLSNRHYQGANMERIATRSKNLQTMARQHSYLFL